jgi:hypothetical protein
MSDIVSHLRRRKADFLQQKAADEIVRLRERRNELMGALLAWLYANDVGDEQKRADAVAYARSVVRDADT